MATPVHSLGALITPTTIKGQGCLAQVTPDTKDWIFSDQSAAANAAAAGVGPGTPYPVGMTLDHMIELYWRWKTMNADISHTLSAEYTGQSGETTATANWSQERKVSPPSGIRPITHERDLILPAPWVSETGYNPISNPGTFPYPPTVIDARIYIFIDPSLGSFPVVKYFAGQYYPRFSVLILTYVIGDEQLGLYQPAVLTYTDITVGYGGQPPISPGQLITSDGTTYDIPLYKFDAGADIASTHTLTLSATQYYPHAKPDGTPKFNITTGAKL